MAGQLKVQVDQGYLVNQISAAVSSANVPPLKIKIAPIDNINFQNINSGAQSAGSAAGKSYGFAFQSALSAIKVNIENDKFKSQLEYAKLQMNQLGDSAKSVKKNIDILSQAFETMNSNKSTDDQKVEAYLRFKQVLPGVTASLKALKAEEKDTAQATKTLTQSATLSNKIQTWMNNNTKAAERYRYELENLQQRLKDNSSASEYSKVNTEFAKIQSNAKAAGLTVSSLGQSLKSTILNMTGMATATMAFSKAVGYLKQMAQQVLAVDTAMTGLRRVTHLSLQGYDELYSKMIKNAKDYGSTLSDMIQSTTDWVKLGFEPFESTELAKITSMYQHVTDLDNNTAVTNLVTAYKGFQDQLTNMYSGDSTKAVEYIADIYDKLGNEYAVKASDVGAGLSKAASSLQMAGNTIQESAGMLTGITEVTQEPENAGNTLKILALRIRGMKGELEELGEEVDENVDSISKVQTQILNMTGGKVNIFKDDGSFKSTYEIMKEISQIYNDLSDTNRASLLETIAGKNRANSVAALISNWKQVESATTAATNATGTAAKENEVYMDSLQGRLDSLKATWQAFSADFLGSDFLKTLVSTGQGFLSLADSVIKFTGVIPALVGAFAGIRSMKDNKGKFYAPLPKIAA